MNLHHLLRLREQEGRPLRIGLIGAGKFGSMFLSQARRTAGIHVLGIADLSLARAKASLARIGWRREEYAARSFSEALSKGTTFITDDAEALIDADGLEVVIDATGSPTAGIQHVLLCCRHRRHIVMVNVEADALAGPLLARRAARAGIVYSLAWGVYVAFAADSNYVRGCFKEYGLVTDDTGNYSAMYRPYHLVGLELGISVASVGLLGEPTGCPTGLRGDVVATAKRDLRPGDILDGEGGYMVYGKLMPAKSSLASRGLPIGLAHGLKLAKSVAAGTLVSWSDVEVPAEDEAIRFRLEMEAGFVKEWGV